MPHDSGISIEQQRIQAEKNKAQRDLIDAKTIARIGLDQFTVLKTLDAINNLQQFGSSSFSPERLKDRIQQKLESIRPVIARGNVNWEGLSKFQNRTLIRNFVGLIVNGVENRAETVINDIENRVIDRVARMVERERKVKDGTSTEIARIVEVGTSGGEQIGTS